MGKLTEVLKESGRGLRQIGRNFINDTFEYEGPIQPSREDLERRAALVADAAIKFTEDNLRHPNTIAITAARMALGLQDISQPATQGEQL